MKVLKVMTFPDTANGKFLKKMQQKVNFRFHKQ